MNIKCIFQGITFSLLAITVGCSGTSPPDPTSAESLRRAPPMPWGTTCVKHEHSSYGTASKTTDTPVCMDRMSCYDADTGSGYGFGGGSEYNSYSYYKDVVYFEGTCEDHHPISCDDRVRNNDCDTCQYQNCCMPVAFCEDDPNCIAVLDCVNGCKNDGACTKRCMNNGEPSAVKHLAAAVECVSKECKDRC